MIAVLRSSWSTVLGWISTNMLAHPQARQVWYTMIATSTAALLFIAMGTFEAGFRALVLISVILYGSAIKDHLNERMPDGTTFMSILRTEGYPSHTIGNVGIISILLFLVVAFMLAFGFVLIQNLVFTIFGVLDFGLKITLGQNWPYPYAAGLPVSIDTIVDGMRVTIWLWVGFSVWFFMHFTRKLVNEPR